MDIQKLIALSGSLISLAAIFYELPKELTLELSATVTGAITVGFAIYKECTTRKKL